jgi:tight adherence protein B
MHRMLGPGLPAALDSVVGALRERIAAADEVRALTSQARLSGWVVGLLPLGFFCVLAAVSPQDLAAAYSSPIGLAAIVGGLVLQAGGFLWIRSLLRVEP